MSDFSKVRSQVEIDLDRIAKLRTAYADAIALAEVDEVENERVVLLGTVLHSFYNGAENAIKRILIAVDKEVPGGDSSHTNLLKQASAPAPIVGR